MMYTIHHRHNVMLCTHHVYDMLYAYVIDHKMNASLYVGCVRRCIHGMGAVLYAYYVRNYTDVCGVIHELCITL